MSTYSFGENNYKDIIINRKLSTWKKRQEKLHGFEKRRSDKQRETQRKGEKKREEGQTDINIDRVRDKEENRGIDIDRKIKKNMFQKTKELNELEVVTKRLKIFFEI